jgi:hypothetical protein
MPGNIEITLTFKPLLDGLDTFVSAVRAQLDSLRNLTEGLSGEQEGLARETGEAAKTSAVAMEKSTSATASTDEASKRLADTLDKLNERLDVLARTDAPRKQEETARALTRTGTAARQATGGLRGFLQTLRERVTDVQAFNRHISNGDVALRKWMALFSGAGLAGLLRNYAQQARQAEQEQRVLAEQIGEAAAREQIAAQSKNDYTRATLELGRAVNDTGRALQSVFTPVISALAPILSTGAATAQAFIGAVGPIAPAAITAAAGLLVLPRAITAVTAAINPLRTLVFALTGQTISRIQTLVTRMMQTKGPIKGWFSVIAGGTKNLEAFGRAGLVAAAPFAALAAGWAIGQTAANLYVKSVEEAAQRHEDAMNRITTATATFSSRVARIRDRKEAADLLPDAQAGLKKAETDLQSFEEHLRSIPWGAVNTYGIVNEDGSVEGRLEKDKARLAILRNEVTLRQKHVTALTNEEKISERTARNLAGDAAREEETRIQSLVAKLSDLRDIAADLDFQKLSPQGQFAALGLQIDALQGKLAALPAPDVTSRESINLHLARQLDLENQIAKAGQKRAQIAKTLDAEEKEAAEKTLQARRTDLAARETLQRSILEQIRHEQTLAAAREDLSPTQKQEAFNALLVRQRTALAEIIRLKKEEIGLAANPAEIARREAEIAELHRQLAAKGPVVEAPLSKIGQQRKGVSELGNGVNSYASIGEGLEGGMLAQLQAIGSKGDQIAQAFNTTADAIRTSLGSAFTDMLWQGESLRDAMDGFASSIAQSFINATAQMVADWIMQNTLMAAWKTLTESKMTLAALFGAKARTAAVVEEETAATGAKAEGTAARTGFSIMDAGKSIVSAAAGAMSAVASVPYVGPILAVAAVASILALGAKIMGAFASGGLVRGPGTGTSDDIIARLSDGEYVMPAATVDRYGVGTMDAIRSGALDLSANVESIPAPLIRSAGTTSVTGDATARLSPQEISISIAAAIVNSKAEAMPWLESRDAMVRMILDTVSENRARLGLQT